MVKDTLEKATEPNFNLKVYLEEAYVHPVFKAAELERPVSINDEENNPLVATKRNSKYASNDGSPRQVPLE